MKNYYSIIILLILWCNHLAICNCWISDVLQVTTSSTNTTNATNNTSSNSTSNTSATNQTSNLNFNSTSNGTSSAGASVVPMGIECDFSDIQICGYRGKPMSPFSAQQWTRIERNGGMVSNTLANIYLQSNSDSCYK